jgi:hypothetical protein
MYMYVIVGTTVNTYMYMYAASSNKASDHINAENNQQYKNYKGPCIMKPLARLVS